MSKGRYAGHGGGMNIGNLMKQAQKMQEDMRKLEEGLAEKEIESTAGGGAVTVIAGGDRKIKKIGIAPELLEPEEAEMLQDMIIVAVNDCLEKAEKLREEEMGRITGGMGKIPGF